MEQQPSNQLEVTGDEMILSLTEMCAERDREIAMLRAVIRKLTQPQPDLG